MYAKAFSILEKDICKNLTELLSAKLNDQTIQGCIYWVRDKYAYMFGGYDCLDCKTVNSTISKKRANSLYPADDNLINYNVFDKIKNPAY